MSTYSASFLSVQRMVPSLIYYIPFKQRAESRIINFLFCFSGELSALSLERSASRGDYFCGALLRRRKIVLAVLPVGHRGLVRSEAGSLTSSLTLKSKRKKPVRPGSLALVCSHN